MYEHLTFHKEKCGNALVNILMAQAAKAYEPMQPLAEQRLHGNDNENLQIGDIKSYELAESLKNKRLAKNFASLLQIGELNSSKIAQKSVININFFLSHYSEIMVMKEQVQMIKGMLAA